MLGRLFTWILATALSVGDPLALAGQMRDAGLEAAEQAYWEGRFEESIRILEALIWTLEESTALREAAFLLGLNRLALGDESRALEDFQTAVRRDPSFFPSKETHSPDIIRAFRTVREGMVGHLVVESDPPGAEVRLGERAVGKTPYIGDVLAGEQTVRAELEGHTAQERHVRVVAGDATNVRFFLPPAGNKALTGRGDSGKPVQEFSRVKLLVVEGDKTTEADAVLRLESGRLVVMSREGEEVLKTLPYSQIKSAEYSYSRHPRWKEGLGAAVAVGVFAAPIFFLKGRKHWLTLQTPDDYAVLHLDKRDYEMICLALETHGGIEVTQVGEKER